jgi:hypothetical protein
LDRGLTALLVGLARHSRADWNPNNAAQRVDTGADTIDDLVSAIRNRAAAITARAENGEEVGRALRKRLDQWQGEQAVGNRQLAYREGRDGTTVGLLRSPGIEPWNEWTCLTSLRDVEPGVRLLLAGGDLGEGSAPAFMLADGAEAHRDGEPRGAGS